MILWKVASATWRKEARQRRGAKGPQPALGGRATAEVADNLAAVDDLQTGAAAATTCGEQLQSLVARVEEKQASQKARDRRLRHDLQRQVVAAQRPGRPRRLSDRSPRRHDRASGWRFPGPATTACCWSIRPAWAKSKGPSASPSPPQAARDADLVLLVVDGPLRESEHSLLARLGEMEKRVLVCLNKADWYDDDEKALLLGQIAGQVRGIVAAEDVLAVRSQPAVRTRVRVLAGGGEQEEQVPVPADIAPLARADAGRRPHAAAASCCWPTCCSRSAAWSRKPSGRCRRRSTGGPGRSSIATPGPAAPPPRSARCRCSTCSPPAP